MAARQKALPEKAIREALAYNVTWRLEDKFALSSSRDVALAKAAGVSLSRVQDARGGEVNVRIDTVAKIARGLGCRPWQLFLSREEQDGRRPSIEPLVTDVDVGREPRAPARARRIKRK